MHLGQAGQPFPQLAQLKQPDVQQLCGTPTSPVLRSPARPGLQAASVAPQLVLPACVSVSRSYRRGQADAGAQKAQGSSISKQVLGPQPPLWAKLFLSAGFLPATCTQDTPCPPANLN